MMTCNGCRFCCWSWAVDVPRLKKEPLTHCQYECKKGCSIFEVAPSACRDFRCPYLDGEPIHRPDTWQKLLEKMGGNIGNYIPFIPLRVPVKKAEELIKKTRSIACAIITDDSWLRLAMPLDRDESGEWTGNPETTLKWQELFHD